MTKLFSILLRRLKSTDGNSTVKFYLSLFGKLSIFINIIISFGRNSIDRKYMSQRLSYFHLFSLHINTLLYVRQGVTDKLELSWLSARANGTLVVKHHPKKHIPKDPKTIMKRHLETELDWHAWTTFVRQKSKLDCIYIMYESESEFPIPTWIYSRLGGIQCKNFKILKIFE